MGVTVRLPFVRCAVLVVAWLSASSSTRAAESIPAPTITLDLILGEHSLLLTRGHAAFDIVSHRGRARVSP